MLSLYSRMAQFGFTLVELMIGLAILAILLSVAMPNFQAWSLNSQIRNAAESVRNGLQRARGEAVARNRNVEFVLLGLDTGCYDATSLISSTCSSWEVRLQGSAVIDSRSSSEGSKAVKRTVTPAGATMVTYNNFGQLTANSGASATPTMIEFDSTKLAAAASRELQIVIGSPGGIVRMCDPHAPSSSLSACQ